MQTKETLYRDLVEQYITDVFTDETVSKEMVFNFSIFFDDFLREWVQEYCYENRILPRRTLTHNQYVNLKKQITFGSHISVEKWIECAKDYFEHSEGRELTNLEIVSQLLRNKFLFVIRKNIDYVWIRIPLEPQELKQILGIDDYEDIDLESAVEELGKFNLEL